MRIKDQDCEGPACDRKAVARDPRTGRPLCKAHYQQSLVRTGRPLSPLQPRRPRNGLCTDPTCGCNQPQYARGLCRPAYMRQWRRRRSPPPKELA